MFFAHSLDSLFVTRRQQPAHIKWIVLAALSGIGLILMESMWPDPILRLPVQGATQKDWNAKTYWHPNWGSSGVHKGIDIFSAHGTAVLAAQAGWVVFQGTLNQGGNVTAVLSPRGWLHYYAHLDRSVAGTGTWVAANETIGFVGNSGNAKGKPAHLHYSILSPIPRLHSFRLGPQGWKRPFYRNPDALLKSRANRPELSSAQPHPHAVELRFHPLA